MGHRYRLHLLLAQFRKVGDLKAFQVGQRHPGSVDLLVDQIVDQSKSILRFLFEVYIQRFPEGDHSSELKSPLPVEHLPQCGGCIARAICVASHLHQPIDADASL